MCKDIFAIDLPENDTEEVPVLKYLERDDVKKYTLRVSLKGVKPVIYRKFSVPSNMSLRCLGELILEMMGWKNEHLHQFTKNKVSYAPQRQILNDNMIDLSSHSMLFSEKYTISDVLNEKGKTILFEYDFGDGWEHDVKLSSVAEYNDGEPREVKFVSGARCCPPEDCGGVWGYFDLCEYILGDKKKKASLEKYKGEEYFDFFINECEFDDPEYFDPDECEVTADFYNRLPEDELLFDVL